VTILGYCPCNPCAIHERRSPACGVFAFGLLSDPYGPPRAGLFLEFA
jgi:hypothetical protein